MTQYVTANNVNTTLAAAASSSSTTLTLASSANLATLTSGQVMPLTLNDAATGLTYEVVYVTAISGVTLTVQRAQEGTGAQNWNVGDYAFCGPTASTVADAYGNPNNVFQVAPATLTTQAVQFGQVSGVVSQSQNLISTVASVATTKVVSADELIVETALGGLRYCLSGLSLTGNLATQMDTGSAPAPGYVAEYVIYNPNAAISSTNPRLLYVNATATLAPSVYGGAYMPAGYTASALISVWPTNSSGQFIVGTQYGKLITCAGIGVASGTTTVALSSLSIAGVVPKNAKRVGGGLSLTMNTTGNSAVTVYSQSATGSPAVLASVNVSSGGGNSSNFSLLPVITAQTLWYAVTVISGTVSGWNISLSQYEI